MTSMRCGNARSRPARRSGSRLQDVFWGERYGQITDPYGHRWGIAQHLRNVPRQEIAEAAAAMFG